MHKVDDDTMLEVAALNSVAMQAARWASEAHVASQEMMTAENPPKIRKNRKRKAKAAMMRTKSAPLRCQGR